MTEPLRLITEPEIWRKEAQPHVVATLEEWLEMAKAGEIVAVTLAGECIDGKIVTAVNTGRNRGLMLGAVAELQYRLARDLDER